MPPQYDPAAVEPRWASEWIERGYFEAHLPSDREPYCIVIPPPNVTGRLHIGHALQHSLQDVLVRRARMQGYETLWLPGMDHAGHRDAGRRGARAAEGRDRPARHRPRCVRRAGVAVEGAVRRRDRRPDQADGELAAIGRASGSRWTKGLSRAVREAFVRWYDEGLIYRGERLVNWCPTDQTGLSDSEVEHEDVDGELVTFRYPLSDGSGFVAVATTRVETMLGDTGIAVHPGDERYTQLVGKTVTHPFDGRRDPDRRGRGDRSGVRDRGGEGHARARPDRLRHRAADRSAADQHLQRGRHRQRERGGGVLRARALRRAHRGPRGAREARPDRRGDPAVRPHRRALLPLSQRDRTVDRGSAVVRRGGRGCAARRRTPRSTGASRSGPGAGRRRSWAGWTTSATGTSRGSSGGVIASRRGTAPTGT